MNPYSYKELMKVPLRKDLTHVDNVIGLYIVPVERIHEDSGYSCMYVIAELIATGEMVRLGGHCDNIKLEGINFNVDCMPGGVMHIWNSNMSEDGAFTVAGSDSAFYLYEGKNKV